MFPATLAILVNVFTVAKERAVAIAVWAATAGIAVALGPVTGGWLLEHFWWGSVLMINVPVVAVAIVAVVVLVPNSRDATIERFDPLGTLLSIGAIGTIVWAVIEGTGPRVDVGDVTGGLRGGRRPARRVRGVAATHRPPHARRVGVHRHALHGGSVAVTFAFFALMGFVFLVTQYFQFVRGYGTLEAGVRTVPFAIFTASTAPLSAKLAERIGTKAVVTAGLASMAGGFAISAVTGVTTSYWVIVAAMLFLGGGLGLVQAPATEAIMGSLPPAKAGVGSAVNDTARELGSTLGVAIVGSVFSSIYAGRLGIGAGRFDRPAGRRRPRQGVGRRSRGRGPAGRRAGWPGRPSRSSATRSTRPSSTGGTPARGCASGSSCSAPWSPGGGCRPGALPTRWPPPTTSSSPPPDRTDPLLRASECLARGSPAPDTRMSVSVQWSR
jgi:MFS family permease